VALQFATLLVGTGLRQKIIITAQALSPFNKKYFRPEKVSQS
jgi:hypothetical protein